MMSFSSRRSIRLQGKKPRTAARSDTDAAVRPLEPNSKTPKLVTKLTQTGSPNDTSLQQTVEWAIGDGFQRAHGHLRASDPLLSKWMERVDASEHHRIQQDDLYNGSNSS